MNNSAVRLVVAAVVVAGTYVTTVVVQGRMQPPDVKLPDWDFRSLPMQLGPWHGVAAADLDPNIYAKIGAAKDSEGKDMVVERYYRDETGHEINVHTAIFDKPDEGIRHSPINCYRSNGHQKISESMLDLQIGEDKTVEVNYSVWEKDGQRYSVLFWYQLGDDFLFDRIQMGGLHWKLGGRSTWPAMIKVLMSTTVGDDVESDKYRLRSLAERVGRWIAEAEEGGHASSEDDSAAASQAGDK
jgi:hypothetical protein